MQLRAKLNELRVTLAPVMAALAFAAICIALIWVFQARTAAVFIGVLTASAYYYLVLHSAQRSVQMSVFWASLAIAADAAYAKLNDQAPVTIVGGIAKFVEALIKLGEGIVRGIGVQTGEARVKMASVAPDFLWAVILTIILLAMINFLVKRNE
jgi:hypothetical protein